MFLGVKAKIDLSKELWLLFIYTYLIKHMVNILWLLIVNISKEEMRIYIKAKSKDKGFSPSTPFWLTIADITNIKENRSRNALGD